MEAVLVYITASDSKEAQMIADALVKERLAACANILDGAHSTFWWQGKIEKADEAVCILKTTRKNFRELNKRVLELHSYDVPCVTALPIIDGNPDFMDWIEKSCK